MVSWIINTGGKKEGDSLDVVKKAELQGGKIYMYFDFCKDIEVINVS